MRMQPHLHGPQYRSVMRIGVTRTMAHDKGAHDSLGCGAVLQYHMFYSLIVSCTTASPCRAGMHYIPIVSCRHVLQPNRVVQAWLSKFNHIDHQEGQTQDFIIIAMPQAE